MEKIPVRVPHRKGQSLMELAISVTFLLVLVAGLVDLGHAIFYYLSLRDAAQEGMVYGVVYPSFCTQIVNVVRNNIGDQSVDVNVTVDGVACESAGPSHACADKALVVTVTQPNFPITMPMLGGLIGTQNLTLSATIRGTVIRPDCT